MIIHCRLNFPSLIPRLGASGSEIVWALRFEIVCSISTVLEALVGSPLENSINTLLVL